jgi:hypothetical protein
LAFTNNEFPIIAEGIEFYFKDFDEITKDEFLTFDIFADVVYSYFDDIIVDEDGKIDWFDRINFAGTQQDLNHIVNIKNKKMYSKKNNIVYKDGKEIANYQEFLEFLNYYSTVDSKFVEHERIFEYSDAIKLRNKFSPFGVLTKTRPFESKIQRGNCIFRNCDYAKTRNIDFDVIVTTTKGARPLQRGLVWTLLQKQSLIETILKDIRIPPISVCVLKNIKDEEIYQIIDGKQRLTTILSFANNEFPIVIDGVEYFYKDFDSVTQHDFKRPIYADVFYSYELEKNVKNSQFFLSDDDKIAWFKKINFAGTPQDLEHFKNFE